MLLLQQNIEYCGRTIGTLTLEYNQSQKEIILSLKVEPDPSLEVRTFSSGPDYAQFTLKEIGLS